MRPVLRVVPTVANARLRQLVRTCECHGVAANQCPSFRTFMRKTMRHARQIDDCARRREGELPVGYIGEEIVIAPKSDALAVGLVVVAITSIVATSYLLSKFLIQWLTT